MEKIDELVKEYYNKIKEHNIDKEDYRNFWDDPIRREQICHLLKVIIEKDREYLLSESFLEYMGDDDQLINNLVLLCSEDYFVIECLERYFHVIFEDILTVDINNHLSKKWFLLLDKTFQKEIIEILNRYQHLWRHDGVGPNGHYELGCIIRVVFAYYLINKRKDNIYELCDIFLDNLDWTYESLYFYNIKNVLYIPEDFVNFVFSKLESAKTKDIK